MEARLPITISPASAVEDDGPTTFTIVAVPDGGKGFDANSVPKFNGTLCAAVVTVVNRQVLTVALDPADLGAGEFAVSVIDPPSGTTIADGAMLVVEAAEP